MILKPCAKKWADLPGDHRRRFCGECGQYVEALAAHTPAEWAALEAQGPFCAYLEGVSAAVPQSRRAMVAGAILTAISPLLAQTGGLRVHVTDSTDTGLGQAQVTVTSPDRKTHTAKTDAKGFADFEGLPWGNCDVTVQSAGFATWRGKHVAGGASKLEVRLEVGSLGGYIVLEPKR